MPKHERKMQSWQIWHYARKYLGASILYAIVGRKHGKRAVDYWCQDPRFTDKPDHASDPISWVKSLIENLDDDGHCHVVRSIKAYLFEGSSSGCDIEPEVSELLPTITEEKLADFRPVVDLHAAIDAGESIDVVNDLKYVAIEEIQRTVAKYITETVRA